MKSAKDIAAASKEKNVVATIDNSSGEHMRCANATGTAAQPNVVPTRGRSVLEPIRRDDKTDTVARGVKF